MKRAIRVVVAALALLLVGGAVAEAAPATPQAVRHFANVRFQKCLDADTNGGGNGTRVQLWDCGPWNQQDWDVRPDGSLYNMRFQKCLDADTNGGGNGTAVQLWDCGPWNQQWWVLRSDGSIYNQRFQKCLDADTNGGGNGTRVQLWDCGPWNQQWWQ
ncbi:RICIN domain-containing protein [Kutzneria buriramensis]|uniref:Endo-1,4-beta-xylanase n=1 Tax=Kutzneria buriramensis TaxID=1045776 RepID=A0A3E0HEB8_9PSEU|nr:RICIN domain-containing protein [Kutzneria buriramensis]REH43582.1 endo-1,4-beta-xylanase [Kutzneria buriramensis]